MEISICRKYRKYNTIKSCLMIKNYASKTKIIKMLFLIKEMVLKLVTVKLHK